MEYLTDEKTPSDIVIIDGKQYTAEEIKKLKLINKDVLIEDKDTKEYLKD